LKLTTAHAGINVFDIDQTMLDDASSLDITGQSGATVIINVDSTNALFQNKGFALGGGTTEAQVLYNFFDASHLTVSGEGFLGSILARNADFSFTSGLVLGNIVVGSATSPVIGQTNLAQFNGALPTIPTPEPASEALLLLTLGAIGLLQRRRSGKIKE
jgi:choice-of-anchor A domain-containing protein/MYXO-CTERM domain-containing protein